MTLDHNLNKELHKTTQIGTDILTDRLKIKDPLTTARIYNTIYLRLQDDKINKVDILKNLEQELTDE